MVWALVDHGVLLPAGASGGNLTLSDTSGAGLIIVFESVYEGLLNGTLSDSYGNTWVRSTGNTFGSYWSDSIEVASGAWWCINPTVGPGHQFFYGGITAGTIAVQAWSGPDITAPIDTQTGYAGGASSSFALPSLTAANVGSLFATGMAGGTNSSGYTIDSSFSISDTAAWNGITSSYEGIGAAYKANTQTEAPTWTASTPSANDLTGIMLVFKPAAGGGGTTQDVTMSVCVMTFAGAVPTINAHQQFTLASALLRFLGQPTTSTVTQNVTITAALHRWLGAPANMNQRQQFILASGVFRFLAQVGTVAQQYKFTITSAIARFLGQPTPVNNTQNTNIQPAIFRFISNVPFISNGVAGAIIRMLSLLGMGN